METRSFQDLTTGLRIERIVLGHRESVSRPECCWNEGSSRVYGPGIVERVHRPDGGVTLWIVEGCRW